MSVSLLQKEQQACLDFPGKQLQNVYSKNRNKRSDHLATRETACLLFSAKKNRIYKQNHTRDTALKTLLKTNDKKSNTHRFKGNEKFIVIVFAMTAGPNHPPKGLLRLNLRIFHISFHFSTKLARQTTIVDQMILSFGLTQNVKL